MSLGLAGTAPGVLLEEDGRIAIALPGPPAELQRLWRNALESEPMRQLLARVPPAHDRVVRIYGATESAVARAFAEAGGEGEGLVATICAHDFEIRVDLVAEPGAEERAAEVEAALVEASGPTSSRATGGRSRSSCSRHAGSGRGRSRPPSRARAGSSPRG